MSVEKDENKLRGFSLHNPSNRSTWEANPGRSSGRLGRDLGGWEVGQKVGQKETLSTSRFQAL